MKFFSIVPIVILLVFSGENIKAGNPELGLLFIVISVTLFLSVFLKNFAKNFWE